MKSRFYNTLSFILVFTAVFSLSYTFLITPGSIRKLHLLGFFTIQTNIIILLLVVLKLYSIHIPRKWEMAAAASITITAVVFQALLRSSVPVPGVDGIVLNTEHGLTTVLFLLWYWFTPKKETVSFNRLYIVLPYPALYCIYGITEGLITGKYRYFFLNKESLGWTGLAIWIAVLAVLFLLAGTFVIAVDRLIKKV